MITFEAIKRKILIVDDQPELLDKMLLFALKDKGYDLSVADNGRHGH